MGEQHSDQLDISPVPLSTEPPSTQPEPSLPEQTHPPPTPNPATSSRVSPANSAAPSYLTRHAQLPVVAPAPPQHGMPGARNPAAIDNMDRIDHGQVSTVEDGGAQSNHVTTGEQNVNTHGAPDEAVGGARSTLRTRLRSSIITIHDGIEKVGDKYENALEEPGGAGFMSSFINIVKGMTGSCLYMLAFVFVQSGVIWACLMIVLFAAFSSFSFWCLGETCRVLKVSTFAELWNATIGKKTAWVVDLMVFVHNLLSNVCHSIVIAEFSQLAINSFTGPTNIFARSQPVCLIVITIVVLLPSSIPKNLSMLRYASTAGMIATFGALVFLICSWVGTEDSSKNIEGSLWNFSPNSNFVLYPTIYSAVCIHFNAPRFYMELKDKSPTNWFMLSWTTFACGACIIILYGIAGVACFGKASKHIIFSNFDGEDSFWAKFVWMLLAVNIMGGFSLNFNSARRGFFGLANRILSAHGKKVWDGTASRVVYTVIALTFITLVAILKPPLVIVNAVKGLTISTCLSGFFPAAFYLLAHSGKLRKQVEDEVPELENDDESAPLVVTSTNECPKAAGNIDTSPMINRLKWYFKSFAWGMVAVSVFTMIGGAYHTIANYNT